MMATDPELAKAGHTSSLGRVLHRVSSVPATLIIGFLRLYQQVVSPLYGPTCRFYPSCSAYAVGAIQTHGVVRGGRLAGWRLLRCNPWNPGGVDDVPPGKQSIHHGHD